MRMTALLTMAGLAAALAAAAGGQREEGGVDGVGIRV